jgi:hypothetical protein
MDEIMTRTLDVWAFFERLWWYDHVVFDASRGVSDGRM